MSRGDGTGPWGQGSMTGRGAGLCGGFQTPGYANPVPGRGLVGGVEVAAAEAGETCTGPRACRDGLAFGSFPGPGGVGPTYGTDMSKAEEVEALRQQAEYFKANLEDIREEAPGHGVGR